MSEQIQRYDALALHGCCKGTHEDTSLHPSECVNTSLPWNIQQIHYPHVKYIEAI